MGRPVENNRKKKKKGRPSLLDLQKRSLRLQKQNALEKNPNPNPNAKPKPSNPYLRFPPPSARRSTARRNLTPHSGDDYDDDEDSNRKERKLELVLRIPQDAGDRAESDSPVSGSDGDLFAGRKKRRIGDVAARGSPGDKEEKLKGSLKAVDSVQGEPLDSGNSTPLPDKKLLLFILDRLQKKDTYGVFSDPVDPEELPDYYEIIDHPMDFGTIRKKLSGGAYTNLEQFERDVFLISSNAMQYNAPDTVYFRQARAIQELAKKDFQNLRQESDEDELEQKAARRGRPPTKSVFKRPVGRPAVERVNSNNSDAVLANAPDNATLFKSSSDGIKNVLASDKSSVIDLSSKAFQFAYSSENRSLYGDHKTDRNEEFSGTMLQGMLTRYGRKVVISEENRRNTYTHPVYVSTGWEPSVFTTFDGEMKELVPVGLHIGYAYARSLARFASALGPIAWEMASKQIERVLPKGTMFGRGWVGEQDAPHLSQPPLFSVSSTPPAPSAPSTVTSLDMTIKVSGASPDPASAEKSNPGQTILPSAESSVDSLSSQPIPVDASLIANRGKNAGNAQGDMHPKVPFQFHESLLKESTAKGLNSGHGLSSSPVGQFIRSPWPTGNFPTDSKVTQNREPGMVSTNGRSFTHPASCIPDTVMSGSSSFSDPVMGGQFDFGRMKNLGTMNAGNGIMHPGPAAVVHLESGRSKLSYSSTINSGRNFVQPAIISNSLSERTENSNSNAINSVSGFTDPAPPSGVEVDSLKVGNPTTPRSVNTDSAASSNAEADKTRPANPITVNSCKNMSESAWDPQGSWHQQILHQKPDPAPDLNVRFHSPTSAPSEVVVDLQQPDLVLQL